jgi:spore germination protein KC
MVKRCSLALLALALVFTGGCWNYRSLSDMTITLGMAIDKSVTGEGYNLTFETIDLTVPVKTVGFKHQLIESEGKTIFDAARNAKKKIMSKLYYGHMGFVLICEDIARSENLKSLIDFYLRDAECRETLCIAVSQEATARELLATEGPGESLISLELRKIIDTDNETTSSSLCYELYELYNILKSEGISAVLPVFRIAYNNGVEDVELNGTAVFKDGLMKGTLSPEESKYFLFVMGKVKGGVLTLSSTGTGPDDTALEISQNRMSRSFRVKDGKPYMTVKTETDVFLNDYKWSTDDIDRQEISSLEAVAQRTLARRIGDVIKRVQSEYGSDIFGFGEMIHKQDPALWKTLEGKWDEIFPSLEVNVECKINIVNTAAIKE